MILILTTLLLLISSISLERQFSLLLIKELSIILVDSFQLLILRALKMPLEYIRLILI
jgi:hypothetical protein